MSLHLNLTSTWKTLQNLNKCLVRKKIKTAVLQVNLGYAMSKNKVSIEHTEKVGVSDLRSLFGQLTCQQLWKV